MKIYCIISKESLIRMKGIRGKLMAQAGHAFLHSFWESEINYPKLALDYKNSTHARKVTLVTETDTEMLDILNRYRSVCGTTKVVDAGFTVFDQPTLTCVGIGPISDDLIQDDLKKLKLLT